MGESTKDDKLAIQFRNMTTQELFEYAIKERCDDPLLSELVVRIQSRQYHQIILKSKR